MAKRLELSSQGALDTLEEEIRWSDERVRSLQSLLPKEASRDRLKSHEVPALEKQLAAEESKLEEASKLAEVVRQIASY